MLRIEFSDLIHAVIRFVASPTPSPIVTSRTRDEHFQSNLTNLNIVHLFSHVNEVLVYSERKRETTIEFFSVPIESSTIKQSRRERRRNTRSLRLVHELSTIRMIRRTRSGVKIFIRNSWNSATARYVDDTARAQWCLYVSGCCWT